MCNRCCERVALTEAKPPRPGTTFSESAFSPRCLQGMFPWAPGAREQDHIWPPSVENHPGGSTTDTWNSHSSCRGGVQSAVCRGPINQAKLPLTHTGRRHATPQGGSGAREGQRPQPGQNWCNADSRDQAGKHTRQTFTKKNMCQLPHRRQWRTKGCHFSFWNRGRLKGM